MALSPIIDEIVSKATDNEVKNLILALDKKFDAIDLLTQQVDSIDRKVDLLTQKVDSIDKKVDLLTQKVDSIDENVKKQDTRLWALILLILAACLGAILKGLSFSA